MESATTLGGALLRLRFLVCDSKEEARRSFGQVQYTTIQYLDLDHLNCK